MKNFITLLLMLSEILLATFLISFIWFLNDKGMPIPKTGFISMMANIFLVLLGLFGPLLSGIFIAFLIKNETE